MSIKKIIVGLLSAGWILPAYLAACATAKYVRFTLIPQITGKGYMTSWPFLDTAFVLLSVSCWWLSGVVVFWSIYALRGSQKAGARAEPNRPQTGDVD